MRDQSGENDAPLPESDGHKPINSHHSHHAAAARTIGHESPRLTHLWPARRRIQQQPAHHGLGMGCAAATRPPAVKHESASGSKLRLDLADPA